MQSLWMGYRELVCMVFWSTGWSVGSGWLHLTAPADSPTCGGVRLEMEQSRAFEAKGLDWPPAAWV